MAKGNWRRIDWLATALAAAVLVPVPASAQFFGFRSDYGYYGQRPSRPPPSRGFFSFPFFSPGYQSSPFYQPAPAPAESYKAPLPTPRKPDAPPPTSTVVVIGDTMADWLAYGLEETFATDSPDIAVERKIRPTSGLIRYDPRNDTLDWAQAVKDALASEKPSVIIVMLGLNDRVSIRDRAPPPDTATPRGKQPAPSGTAATGPQAAAQGEKQGEKAPAAAAPQDSEQPPTAASERPTPAPPGGAYEFHTDKWAELYAKRIDDMMAALKSKGVPVLWVGLPALWGTRGTADMSYLDELYREHAERAGIVYVDIWDGFVDENGRFASQGPDFEGQIRRLRTGDGIHFTKVGALKLAQYVVQDLRRMMTNRTVPVALPAPEETPGKPAAPGTAVRPVAGPVLPLTTAATSGNDTADLLGAGSHPVAVNADPVAVEVLSKGDPVAAPHGRADDFTWPRPGSDADGTADAEPEPGAASPAAPPKAAAPSAAKKPDDGKAKGKAAQPAPSAPSTTVPPGPRAQLGAAPRPPAPAGGF